MEQARDFQNKKNFLVAAKLYSQVSKTTSDTLLRAEALYRFVECGDAVAALASNFKDQFEEFSNIGIQIKQVSYFETYYVNLDTITRQYLVQEYPHTKWGERARYDLITKEITYEGYPSDNNPRPIISKAFSFLEFYPKSEYRYDVYYILAHAYTDLWNFTDEQYADLLTEDEKKNPDHLRTSAIQYLKLVKANREDLKFTKWDSTDANELNTLKKHGYTNGYYFFGD
jgi:hypothetical protein